MDLSKIKVGDVVTVRVTVLDCNGALIIPHRFGNAVTDEFNIKPEDILEVVSPVRVGDSFQSRSSGIKRTLVWMDNKWCVLAPDTKELPFNEEAPINVLKARLFEYHLRIKSDG